MKRDLILTVALIVVSLVQNLSGVDTTEFHPDETFWLNSSRYLQDAVAPWDRSWSDHWLTRGQLPGWPYALGIGLVVQGRPLEPNRVWTFFYEPLYNVRGGSVPTQVDLTAGRRTSALIGALAVGAVYLIGRRLTTRLGGVIGALVLAFHPLMIELSSQALTDAFLVLVLALIALAACWLADRPTWPRALLLGTCLGFGGLIKLSPLLLAIPLSALGVLLLAQPRLPWVRLRGTADPGAMRLGERLLPLPIVAFTVFVAGYPYLWPDPIGRAYTLFAHRVQEMTLQQERWPPVAITSPAQALERILMTLGERLTVTGRLAEAAPLFAGLPSQVDLFLAIGGIAALLWLIRCDGLASPQALAGVILLAQTALIVAGLRVDYTRYYLPLVFVGAVTIGVLAGLGTSTVSALIRRTHPRPERAPGPAVSSVSSS